MLKAFRAQKNLTMKQVSKQVGISESYYCLLEHGLRHPSISVARKLGAALDFDWLEIYADDDAKVTSTSKEV